jgi:hypothetical protein
MWKLGSVMRGRSRRLIGLWLVCAAVLAAPSSAANLAPTVGNLALNGGFEDFCGDETYACFWPSLAGDFGYIFRDVSAGRGGSAASWHIHTFTGTRFARSACFPPHSPGPATLSLWYRTSDPRVTSIEAEWDPQSTSLCGGGLVGFTWSDTAPVTDGEWHQTSPGVASQIIEKWYTFTLGFKCPTGCPDADVFLDDVALVQAPTAAALSSFTARATARGIRLSWRMVSEVGIVGFDLHRVQAGNQVELNRRVIQTHSGFSAGKSAYTWMDRTIASNPAYRLEAVMLDGNRQWVGAAHPYP